MSMNGEVIGGRYRVGRLLGRGGTSDVFEAIDERTGGPVAIKVVRSDDPEFVRRLVEEARALESFDGPGLVRFLDTGVHGDRAYLVMEYIDGPTLAQSLKDGPLGTAATAAIAARVASALSYVHERGIVHRDVKPSNILRSSTGEVWLADFGIAKFDDATTITAPGTTIGTVIYMAPEQLDGQRVGPSADIWSLGIVILECLTGRRVFEGSPSEIVAKRLTGPVVLPKDLPKPWTVLLNGMLDPRPDHRLRGAEVAALLESSAYVTPWVPGDNDETQVLGRSGSSDETQVLGRSGPVDQTFVMPGVVAPVRGGDETLFVQPSRTPDHHTRRPWVVIGVLLVAGALIYALVASLFGGSTPGPTSTTTTTLRATTTTTLSSSTAIAALMSDLATSQAAGSIAPAVAQSISQFANQSLIDNANANLVAVEDDLQQAMTTIVDGVASSTITPTVGSKLEHDVSTLATALGVATPSTTTTTTTTPFVVPGPGNGNGHGNGNGRH